MGIRLFYLFLSSLFLAPNAIARDLPNCNPTIIKWNFGVAEGYYPDATTYDVDQDNFPRGLAVDDKGYIYVGDGVNYEILKFNPSGQLVWKTPLQPTTIDKPELGYEVSAVAIGPNNDVFVWNRTSERIEIYSGEGNFKKSFPLSLRGSNQPSNDGLYVSKSGEVIACHGAWRDCLKQDRSSGAEIKIYSLNGDYLRDSEKLTPTDPIMKTDYIGKNDFDLHGVYDTKEGRCITIQKDDKDLLSCIGAPQNRDLHHQFDSAGNLYFLLDKGVAVIRPDYAHPVIFKDLPNYRRDCNRKLDLRDMSMEKLISLLYKRKLQYLEQEDPELRNYLLKQKPDDLRLLRNTFYARQSYKFKDKNIGRYFKEHFPDYRPDRDNVEPYLGPWERQDLNYLREIEEIVLGKSIDETYGGASKRPERHGASKREVIDLTNIKPVGGETWFRMSNFTMSLYFPPKYYEQMTGVKHIKVVYSPFAGYVLLHTDNKGNDNKQGTNLWVMGLNKDTGIEFYTNKYAGQDLDLDWLDEFSFTVKYTDSSDRKSKADIYRRQNDKWYRKSEWKLQTTQETKN